MPRVQKPARYRGNEWNAWHKDHSRAGARMVMAFPDLYEVGMSNQGLKILYHAVNDRPNLLMERVFAPAVDMEALMRKEGVPLFALESAKPLTAFDLIGFSLQYELSYSNVLNMLDLAGLALHASRRLEDDPLVIGGGPCAYNPEPLAPFFDLFLIGEAEEALPELLELLAAAKGEGASRRETLNRLAALAGVYIPSFYRPRYKNGVLQGMERLNPKAPAKVNKRVVADLDSAPYPTAPVVSYIQVVHDRAVVELFRGCGRGCRFCQAGFIFRPVRRRSRKKIVETAAGLIKDTGYEELSLSSLSSSDYPGLGELIDELDREFAGSALKCSLPSLRLDSYSVKLADRLHRGRRSSLTFAPEAATERLRRIIRKDITEEEIFSAVEAALAAGWQGFKFYFMIGLPGEEMADVEAIIDLCRRIQQHARSRAKKRISINVSAATFVPKAHTPFQWEPQLPLSDIIKRQQVLRQGFKKMPGIDFSWHEAEVSMLEAVFARGDRTLAPLLEKAWDLGCRFDGWSEHFSFRLWQQAFNDLGLKPEDYASRRFSAEDFLPWDHLHCGLGKDFFSGEYGRFLAGRGAGGAPI